MIVILYLTCLLLAIADQGSINVYFPLRSVLAAEKILDIQENNFGVAEPFKGELCGIIDEFVIKYRFRMGYIRLWDSGELEADIQLPTKIYNGEGDLIATIPEVSKKIKAEGGLPFTVQLENAITCIETGTKNLDDDLFARIGFTLGESGGIKEIGFYPRD